MFTAIDINFGERQLTRNFPQSFTQYHLEQNICVEIFFQYSSKEFRKIFCVKTTISTIDPLYLPVYFLSILKKCFIVLYIFLSLLLFYFFFFFSVYANCRYKKHSRELKIFQFSRTLIFLFRFEITKIHI